VSAEVLDHNPRSTRRRRAARSTRAWDSTRGEARVL